MSRVETNATVPDPDELLARLVENYRAIRGGIGAPRLELYHRASLTRRVARDLPDASTSSATGGEDGIAVRIWTAAERRSGFAASSGYDLASLRWAIARARSAAGDRPGPGVEIPSGVGSPIDRDAGAALPDLQQMESWLDRACSRLRRVLSSRGGPRIGESWVEVAITLESLVTNGGFTASRVRRRAWAMARLRSGDATGASPRPLFAATRSWEALSEAEWADLARDRRLGEAAPGESVRGRMPVLFAPEAAGVLVAALARTLHSRSELVGAAVGPGWRVLDDPRAPGALFGGEFDDAGFATLRRELADGSSVREPIAGPGTYRRPSFRDPPNPLPAHLVLESGPDTAPPHGLRVSEVTLHPLPGGKWVLECAGAAGPGTESGTSVQRALIGTAPGHLVQRCVARIGAARQLYRGVQTPALLFDGLEVRL